MSKIARKLGVAAIALLTIVSVSGITPAAAQTTAELQAQITALLAQISALQAQLGGSTTTGGTTTTYNFTRDLTLGSTGEDVKALQQYLNANGYVVAASGAGSVGNESTYFGSLTQAALAKFQAANGISPAAGYFGPITRSKIASMGSTTPTTPTTPASAPLTVSLAADNPASANVQKGSANNTVLKLVFTGGSTPVSITGLTLKSYGTTEATGTTDVTAVKLYDENNIQIGTDRTPAGNQVNFVIVPPITVPANGTRTISVTANIGAATTNVLAAVRYGLESASAIMGGITFTGNYPIVGNSFTIVPAGQLGGLSVSKYGSVPTTSVKVGQKDVIVERFNVSAGSNEDIVLNQVTLTNTGSITGSDISNLRLRKVGDTTVLGTTTLTNNKATFNLTTPISLTKGASVNLEVVADIADGGTNSRTIIMAVATGGAVGRGVTSGTNVTSTGSTTGTTITLGNETLTVSMSASHPQGASSYIIETTNKKDIAKFDIRANGGDVIINTILVKFVNATSAFTSSNYFGLVGLYDGDSLVSDLVTVDDENNQTFSLNWTVPANTTRTLTVKGVTSGLDVAAPDTVTTSVEGYTAYGLASGATLSSTASVSSTAITVYASGKAIPTADSTKTPYAQGILAPINNVTLAALKVHAQREDLKLTDLVVTVAGTGYDDEADISSISLYADDGVTQLTNPVTYDDGNDDTTDTFTIDSADFISDVIFTKDQYKTILVKANAASTITDTTAFVVTLANAVNQLKFSGQDSASTYDMKTDTAGLNLYFTSPYAGGTFSFDNHLIEMKKAATSPSGSVSRGTLASYAIWDVANVSSDLADLVISHITFTSKTGLPSGLTDGVDADDALLFELYDGEGNRLAYGADGTDVVTLVKGSGTITFVDATNGLITVSAGSPKQLVLKITTTDTAKWPSSTQMQWSVEVVGDAKVQQSGAINGVDTDATDGRLGYGGTTWSIPAVTNIITLP